MEQRKILKYANIILITGCVLTGLMLYLIYSTGTSEISGALMDFIKLLGIVFYTIIVISLGLIINLLVSKICKKLNIGEEILFFITLVFIFFNIYLCNSVFSSGKERVAITENLKEKEDNRAVFLNFSKNIVKPEIYNYVLKSANDSLKNWVNNSLSTYSFEKNNQWQIDSLICFNSDGTKCRLVIKTRDTLSVNSTNDLIRNLYGVKIRNDWYYFAGPSIIVFRKLPNQDTFEELSETTMSSVFQNYLKKSLTGEWEINERFFSDLTSAAWYVPGWSEPKTKEDWDKVYLYHINENWKNKDTTQY